MERASEPIVRGRELIIGRRLGAVRRGPGRRIGGFLSPESTSRKKIGFRNRPLQHLGAINSTCTHPPRAVTPDRPPQQAPRACHGMPSGSGPAWPPQVTPAGPRVSHTIYTTHRERQPAWASRFSLIVRLWRFGRPLWSSGGWAGRAVKRSKIENSEILLPWPPSGRGWNKRHPEGSRGVLHPSPATRRPWQEDLRISIFDLLTALPTHPRPTEAARPEPPKADYKAKPGLSGWLVLSVGCIDGV